MKNFRFLLPAALSVCLLAQGGSDYAARGRALVEQLAAGHFAAATADFTPQMKAALTPEKLQAAWEQVGQQVGPFHGIASASVQQQGGRHAAIVACKFGDDIWQALVVFDAQNKVAGLFFRPQSDLPQPPAWTPPAYAQTGKFHEEAITVADGAYELPGTLTLPNGTGPFPAVVLVQGSGPEDRDETIGPNKPFKDLAWGLASQGVAVLRYEKRTKKYGSRSAPSGHPLTVADETMDDARAAVALAARRGEINPEKIYLLGHSLGAYLAPRIAGLDPQIAGIILLAGPTRPLAETIVDQMRYLATLPPDVGGVPQSEVAAAEAAEREINSPALQPGQNVNLLGAQVPGAYFLDLRHYDPAAVAAKLTIPILVLQGGRDYQVTRADYAGWQKALAGHENAHFQFFPDLDHLFMTAPGSGLVTPNDYTAPGHVAAAVVDAIAAFVRP